MTNEIRPLTHMTAAALLFAAVSLTSLANASDTYVDYANGQASARVPMHRADDPERGPWKDVRIDVGGSREYDSNVFLYSPDDVELFDAGGLRNTKFRDIESTDDWRTSLGYEAGYSHEFFQGQVTTFSQRSRFHIYDAHSSKNYGTYSFELKHKIHKKDIVTFSYSYVPEYFLRNLYDEDDNTYRPAEFSKSLFVLRYWKQWNRRLRSHVSVGWDDKDYNDPFDERDNLSRFVRVGLTLPRVMPGLRVMPHYEFRAADASGEDGDAALDQDISYRQNEIGIRLAVELNDALVFEPFYTLAFKSFTGDRPLTVDPLHTDREDVIYEVGARLQYVPAPNWTLYAEYAFTENNAELADSLAATNREDVLGYRSHQVNLGGDYRF